MTLAQVLDSLPPHAGIWWGQGTAEPLDLVDAFLARASTLGSIDAFIGLTMNNRLTQDLPPSVRVVSYGALGTLRKLTGRGRLEIIPEHYSALPRLFARKQLPTDLGLLQVSPPDADGRVSLGVCADYMADALHHTKTLVAEINHSVPSILGPRVPLSAFALTVESERELPQVVSRAPDEIDQRIAANVAELVRNGDTIQLGVGSLPDAVLSLLSGHRDLGLHSGIITDGALRLMQEGVITNACKEIDTGISIAGSVFASGDNYDLAATLPLQTRPTSYTHSPRTLSQLESLVSINSAIQVDLFGQVGAESAAGRSIGAIGGQVDFSRAASLTGSRSIIVLRSTVTDSTGLRSSTIVPRLEVPVTTPRTDVDFIVTEHGVAELTGRTPSERRRRIRAIADPIFQEDLS